MQMHNLGNVKTTETFDEIIFMLRNTNRTNVLALKKREPQI